MVTTGTQFWLIGANPSFTDLASLKAAVAGLSIGMAPGPGAPTRHLIGLDEEPLVPPGTRGREFLLDLNTVGELRVEGDGVASPDDCEGNLHAGAGVMD